MKILNRRGKRGIDDTLYLGIITQIARILELYNHGPFERKPLDGLKEDLEVFFRNHNDSKKGLRFFSSFTTNKKYQLKDFLIEFSDQDFNDRAYCNSKTIQELQQYPAFHRTKHVIINKGNHHFNNESKIFDAEQRGLLRFNNSKVFRGEKEKKIGYIEVCYAQNSNLYLGNTDAIIHLKYFFEQCTALWETIIGRYVLSYVEEDVFGKTQPIYESMKINLFQSNGKKRLIDIGLIPDQAIKSLMN